MENMISPQMELRQICVVQVAYIMSTDLHEANLCQEM